MQCMIILIIGIYTEELEREKTQKEKDTKKQQIREKMAETVQEATGGWAAYDAGYGGAAGYGGGAYGAGGYGDGYGWLRNGC
jgi:hypothetical protein